MRRIEARSEEKDEGLEKRGLFVVDYPQSVSFVVLPCGHLDI